MNGVRNVCVNGRTFPSMGGRVIRFIESTCCFSNGRWTSAPFVLQDWQKRLIWELFEVDPDSGRRRYRRALVGVPRKNGKSELAAALALYFMLADGEPSSEVVCAASNELQADRVFDAARRMCEMSEALTGLVDVSVSKLSSKDDPYSSISRLSSKGRTKYGLNLSCAILDELHAWGAGENAELWTALSTSMAARSQPMQLMITTAGADKEGSRCGELYDLGVRIQAGEPDDGFFFRWWQAPDGCDYRDPEMWRLANPSLGTTISEDFLRGELQGAGDGAVSEADFRRLYLNQWVDFAEVPWLQPGQWADLDVGPFEFETRAPTWIGVDLSETRDSTAVVTGQLWAGEGRPCGHTGEACLYVKLRAWQAPMRPDGRPLEGWRVPQNAVKDHIREMAADYDVAAVIFDPWHSRLIQEDLQAEGIRCESIWQSGARRWGATGALYDRIVQGRLHHDGDPVFARHMANAAIKAAPGGEGYYLAKRKGGAVMDGAMGLVNVVYGTNEVPMDPTGNWIVQ